MKKAKCGEDLGEGGSRVEGVNGGNKGTSVILLT